MPESLCTKNALRISEPHFWKKNENFDEKIHHSYEKEACITRCPFQLCQHGDWCIVIMSELLLY